MSRPKGSKEKSHIETLNWDKLEDLIDNDKLYGYREFCRILNLPIKSSGSGSQIKQLEELRMICEYEKINTKYKFIRMRNKDELFLYKENHKFSPLIEYALTEKFLELSNKNYRNFQDGILFFSMGDVLIWCGIVHNNFEYFRKNKSQQYKMLIGFKHQIESGQISSFVNISYEDILKPMVRTAIQALDNKKSIVIHKGFKLYRYDGITTIYKNILGTSELGRKLERIVANVYTEYNIGNKQELFVGKKYLRQQIYDRCNEVCKVELGFDGFYDCYAIIINQERSRYNLEVLKEALNQNTIGKISSNIKLDEFSTGTKNKLIGTLIDLKTDADFQRDIEEYTSEVLGG